MAIDRNIVTSVDPVPHFSTFGKNYTRRFKDTDLFEQIFQHILEECYRFKLVDPTEIFVDATHVKARANNKKMQRRIAQQEALFYADMLRKDIDTDREKHGKKPLKDKNDHNKPGAGGNDKFDDYTDDIPLDGKTTKCSTTDPESGWFRKGEHKHVFAYWMETACDKNGWIIDFTVNPGNEHDSRTFKGLYDKKEQVVDKLQQSIKERGHDRSFLFMILFNAVEFLEKLIREFILKLELRKEKKDALTPADQIQGEPVNKEKSASNKVVEPIEEKPTIPPRTKAPALLLKWNQMLEANDKLKKQNQAIFKVESDRNDVYMELAKCTGIFKAGKRKKLQEEYDDPTEKIDNMKSRLSKIVQEYGYKTVDEFYRLFNIAVDDYDFYQRKIRDWKINYGEKSLHRKLKEMQSEVNKRQEVRETNVRSLLDRGAR